MAGTPPSKSFPTTGLAPPRPPPPRRTRGASSPPPRALAGGQPRGEQALHLAGGDGERVLGGRGVGARRDRLPRGGAGLDPAPLVVPDVLRRPALVRKMNLHARHPLLEPRQRRRDH